MRLPEEIRKRFVRYGPQGGKARALRLNAESRRAIAQRGAGHFKKLVEETLESVYAKYPRLSPRAVREAVESFLSGVDT